MTLILKITPCVIPADHIVDQEMSVLKVRTYKRVTKDI